MKRSHLILAWLLLLVPALSIGIVALRLLARERENIAMMTRASAMQQAEAAAEGIDLAVGDVKDGLIRTLRGIAPDEGLVEALQAWQQGNPLVRNVFVIRLPDRVVLPDPDRPANQEEGGFLERYQALLSGRVPWQAPALDLPGPPAPVPVESSAYRASRKTLYQTAQQRAAIGAAGEAPPVAPPAGWLTWTWENRTHLLGWVEGGGYRYGVELEMVAMMSQLVGSLPAPALADGVLALLDDNGAVVYQRGAAVLDAETPELAAAQIGPALPHWQVSLYAPAGAAPATGRAAMTILSGLLVGSFVAAIVLGGSLLLWQAHRNLLDARQKTSFVSNVSHELKTPLTTIRMYAELLGEGRVSDGQKRRRYLDVIVEESRRLTRLVNNVLDFSRLEQGRKQYHPEPLDLASSVRGLLDTQLPRLTAAGLKVEASIPDRPVPVLVDRDTLEQVLLNLVDNAIKYAAAGGGLTVAIEGDGRLDVCDRGPGIPPAHRERIFEQFHRVDNSLTAAQPGSGLGLSIARRQMRDLGGDVTYEPRAGGGACFTVRFPPVPARC